MNTTWHIILKSTDHSRGLCRKVLAPCECAAVCRALMLWGGECVNPVHASITADRLAGEHTCQHGNTLPEWLP